MPEFLPDPNRPLRVVGRYALYGKLASGGMATVHFGRLLGPVGFSRTVAIKRLHPQFAKDPEFVAMFLDEARLAARIQHPNVVATVDVVAMEEELFLVMDYIRGESFSRLLRGAKRRGLQVPEGFIANVVASMLHGLHAAHDATDERGQPLRVVHRDVSPQNVLVGTDGVARVLDFGVAKAAARIQVTRDGQMKGKLSYMSPEQLSGISVDRRSDVFAGGVVLWEALTGERLFTGDDVSDVLSKILKAPIPAPSTINPKLRPQVDRVVMRALERNPDARYQTAREFAIDVEETMQLMSHRAVGEWVERIAGESLERRERALAEIESISSVNELSNVTPSDPGFMKTLTTQVRGRPPPLPPRAKKESPGPVTPAVPSGERDADEAATTIYHSPPPPSPPPLPNDAFAAPPAVIVAELSASEEDGQGDNPFKRSRTWLPYAYWAGGGMLVVGLAYFTFAAVSSLTASPKPRPALAAPEPTKATVQNVQKQEPARPPPSAVDLSDLPEAPVAEAEEGEPEPRPKSASSKSDDADRGSAGVIRKPVTGTKPAKPAKCAQPWYVDDQGIRRIKADCL